MYTAHVIEWKLSKRRKKENQIHAKLFKIYLHFLIQYKMFDRSNSSNALNSYSRSSTLSNWLAEWCVSDFIEAPMALGLKTTTTKKQSVTTTVAAITTVSVCFVASSCRVARGFLDYAHQLSPPSPRIKTNGRYYTIHIHTCTQVKLTVSAPKTKHYFI